MITGARTYSDIETSLTLIKYKTTKILLKLRNRGFCKRRFKKGLENYIYNYEKKNRCKVEYKFGKRLHMGVFLF